MVLKGLPFYDITEVDGELMVWGLRSKRMLGKYYNPKAGFRMKVDGELRFFSEGHLRFLMKHPDIHASTITPQSDRITFDEEGNVRHYDSEFRLRKFTTFQSLDDALNTVLLLMSVQEGNDTPIAQFVAESRDKACVIVGRIMHASPSQVSAYLADGERLFYEELANFKVEKLQPLFAWFCKCIKVEMIKARRKVSIDKHELDNTLILQKH